MKTLNDYYLIEPVEAETKTASGLYLPDTAQEKPALGTILSLPDTFLPKLAVGSLVYYKKWGGNTVKKNGKELVFVEGKDLMGIDE